MIGQTLGHYHIEAQLGAGGMGVVYRAHDTRLERVVAVKVIAESLQTDSKARARLIQEARAASALNHPNICTIHEVGEAGGRSFIVMEYVEGRPLSAVARGDGLPVETIVRYGSQIADALAHAHERGVVHRDLKSSNVMVTPEGRPKVLDFGLAKRLRRAGPEDPTVSEGLTEAGAILGTLAYMAPEALRGEAADARSDIWALGVMLYEMASGRLPFRGGNLLDLTAAIVREPIPELPARVAPGLAPIVHRCLAREAGERYQRAGEVRAALEAIGSAPRAMPAVAALPVSRRRWVWGTAAVVTLAAAAVVGTLHWRTPRTYAPIPSKVPEANEYLQRALLISAQGDLLRARQMLEKALELDPKFALARAWYGFSHMLQIDTGLSNDTSWLYEAEKELRRALEDDPNSARAHAALAMVYMYQGRKDLMPQEARKAIDLDPQAREGYQMLAMYHHWSGEYEQALALFRKVLGMDPLSPPARWHVGEILRKTGDPKGAIREHQKVLELNPKLIPALGLLAMAHRTAGDLASARRVLEQARGHGPPEYTVRLHWAVQLAVEGKREEALREMDAGVLKYAELPHPCVPLAAEFYAVLGDKTKALDWLDRAVRSGDEEEEWFERNPLLKNIREEPRFGQILNSIRFRRQQRAKSNR